MNEWCQVAQLQRSPAAGDGCVRANDLADPAAVEMRDPLTVDHKVVSPLLDETPERGAEGVSAFLNGDAAVDLQNADVSDPMFANGQDARIIPILVRPKPDTTYGPPK